MTNTTLSALRTCDCGQLTRRDRERWLALEASAIERNAYASPHFVLPALKHLEPGVQSELVLIESESEADDHAFEAVFPLVRRRACPLVPFPHVEIYHSIHSFCGSPLIAGDDPVRPWRRLLDHLQGHPTGTAALVVRQIELDGAVHRALRQACESLGLFVDQSAPKWRAMLHPKAAGEQALKQHLGKQANELARCRRRLGDIGQLSWHIHRQAIESSAIDNFLRLEHAGWKAEAGSSLRADPRQEAFFREMMTGFAAEGRALFTELRLDGHTIASTSNLVSGNRGFAFKVGWDPQYRKFGIGILNEAELVRRAPEVCGDLDAVDSGAEPDSFIEKLWAGRRPLVTCVVAFGAVARLTIEAVRWARNARQRWGL